MQSQYLAHAVPCRAMQDTMKRIMQHNNYCAELEKYLSPLTPGI